MIEEENVDIARLSIQICLKEKLVVADWVALVANKDPTCAKKLEAWRMAHNRGETLAARRALHYCAITRMQMPEWLAEIVNKAICDSDKGKPDEQLGFGNKLMPARWRKAHLTARNKAVQKTFKKFSKESRGELAKLAQSIMQKHNFSGATLDKI